MPCPPTHAQSTTFLPFDLMYNWTSIRMQYTPGTDTIDYSECKMEDLEAYVRKEMRKSTLGAIVLRSAISHMRPLCG